jgi:hypothetical protein
MSVFPTANRLGEKLPPFGYGFSTTGLEKGTCAWSDFDYPTRCIKMNFLYQRQKVFQRGGNPPIGIPLATVFVPNRAFFLKITRHQTNSYASNTVIKVMEDLYHSFLNSGKQNEKESANRLLKRLRLILIAWLVSFVASVLWFSFSPSL